MGNHPKKIRIPRIQTPFESPINRFEELVLESLDKVLRELDQVKADSADLGLPPGAPGDIPVGNADGGFDASTVLTAASYTTCGDWNVGGGLVVLGLATVDTVLSVSGMAHLASGLIVTGETSLLQNLYVPQSNVGIGGYFTPIYPLEVYAASPTPVAFSVTGGTSSGSNDVQVRFGGRKDGQLWAIGCDIAADGGNKYFEVYDLADSRSAVRITPGTSGNMRVDLYDNLLVSGNATAATYLNTHGFQIGVVTKAVNYTLTSSDFVVLANATTGNLTMTLPVISGAVGMRCVVKKIDSSANTVTVAADAGHTIDGASTKVISSQYTSYEFVNDGSTWYLI